MRITRLVRMAPLLVFAAALFCAAQAIKARDFCPVTNARPPQKQGPVKKILRAEDFADPRLPRGSGLEDVEFVVEISPRMAPYLFHLIPNRDAQWSEEPRFVGRIEISRIGESSLLQMLDVAVVADASWFTKTFCAKDINFDGYLDIMVVSDHGAKWGSYQYWVFDPGSRRFITNELTRQLGELKANTRDWNSRSRTLHLSFLNLDQARIGETYRIENGRLTLIEIEERQKDCDGNYAQVASRIIDGKRDGKDIFALEPCKQLTQNIAKDQVQAYGMRIEASQSLVIGIETHDIDLSIRLIAPSGEELAVREVIARQDNFGWGSAKISWIAKSSGVYRAEVRSTGNRSSEGIYYVMLQQPRLVTPPGPALWSQTSSPSKRSKRNVSSTICSQLPR